jgi:Zn-dependent alcohol dehydrogenase
MQSVPFEVRGVVVREPIGPVGIEAIVLPDPGPGEVVVDIAAINTGGPTRRLGLEGFVCEQIGLADVQEAFEHTEAGDVLRSVVLV